MALKEVDHISMRSSDEERLLFELFWLRERVRNLEQIVHELMRDRIPSDLADSWLETAHDKGGWTPALHQIQGRGQRIAALLDVWPAEKFPASKWSPKPDPKEK